jgi:hypothetical protein
MMQFANVSKTNWFHTSVFLVTSGLSLAVMSLCYPIDLDCESILAILGDKYRREAIYVYIGFGLMPSWRTIVSHFSGFCETQHETVSFVCRHLHIHVHGIASGRVGLQRWGGTQ